MVGGTAVPIGAQPFQWWCSNCPQGRGSNGWSRRRRRRSCSNCSKVVMVGGAAVPMVLGTAARIGVQRFEWWWEQLFEFELSAGQLPPSCSNVGMVVGVSVRIVEFSTVWLLEQSPVWLFELSTGWLNCRQGSCSNCQQGTCSKRGCSNCPQGRVVCRVAVRIVRRSACLFELSAGQRLEGLDGSNGGGRCSNCSNCPQGGALFELLAGQGFEKLPSDLIN